MTAAAELMQRAVERTMDCVRMDRVYARGSSDVERETSDARPRYNAPAMRGRISVNPRGFVFVPDVEDAEGPAFVVPPDLNRFLADDVVTCRAEIGPNGKSTARDLVLVERPRTRLFGDVVTRGGKTVLRGDRLVAHT